jgi:type IV fimbrial biogenesis protein FimT
MTSAVASVLAVAGMPSLGRLLTRQAVLSEVDDFQGAVQRMRSEAIRRGLQVTLCARDPAAGERSLSCRPSGQDWSAGWVLFVDRGKRGSIDADDEVLQVHQPSRRAGSVQATLRYLSFQPIGISSSAASHFLFVPAGGAPGDERSEGSRMVCVNKPGRVRVLEHAPCG